MFAWHETTLRRLCRLAFGLSVAVPTCAVLLAIVWCRCPLSVEYYRRGLAEQLALDVQLERVSFPRPHVTVLRGLSLADPETTRPLARIEALEWRTQGQKSSIACSRVELLDVSRLDLVAEMIARRLRNLAGSKAVVELTAQELTLCPTDGIDPLALTKLRGLWQSEPSKPPAPGAASVPQGTIEFHLKGEEAAAPARILFFREASPRGAMTSARIETGPTPIESRLIDLCCPGWVAWGADSSFSGELWWQRHADGPAGGVRGRVTGIDLDKLVSTQSEHRLTGTAEVQLDRARFENGRLLDATGSIHAGPGLVGRSLLAAAASELHCAGNNPPGTRDDLAPYDEMAFHFALSQRGLILQGLCSGSRGAVFVGRVQGRLLGEPKPGLQSQLGIVRLLAALGDAVPADPAAQALLRLLPMPAAEPSGVEAPRAQLETVPRR